MNKKLKILSAALLISSAGVLSAMEDAATRDGLLARMGALVDAYTAAQHVQVDQLHLAAAMQPHHALLVDTDTELLIKCMQSGDMQPYFVQTKNNIKAKIDVFVDSLLAANGNFLAGGVMVGGHNQPANLTRDAFKAAMAGHIDTVHLAIPAPVNAKISSLARCEEGVHSEFAAALDAHLHTLLAANGQFLAGGVMVGGHNQPADNTRDAFANALIGNIFN